MGVPLRLRLGVKRLLDIVMAALLLVALSPVVLLVAMAVLVRMGPPVIFAQPRIGQHGRIFTLHKFRTMTNARDDSGVLKPDGERLTRLGTWLRSMTFDEIPELFDVLRGHMSIVGPRPLLVEYRDLYTPEQWRRHEMRPGMAGPVLAGGRNALTWTEKFALDVWYVDNWSLKLDAQILVRTAQAVLEREGLSADGHATMPKFTGRIEAGE